MELGMLRSRYCAVLYTLSSALCGECLVNKMPAEAIYSHASRHSLGALACHGLELAGAATPDMTSDKLAAIRRAMLFDNARAEICKRLDSEKIKYILLKGIVLKELYPAIGLREMADNDILIDPSCRRRMREIMRELGYKAEAYNNSNHDVYIKEPFLNFEIHVSLFSSQNEHFSKYFKNVFDRAIHISENRYEYVMRDEDFYIYIKTHEYKHYTGGGTGLRSLVDTYLFMSSHAERLDMEYIERECRAIGIYEYERQSRLLAMHIFDKNMLKPLLDAARGGILNLSDDEMNMLDYICSSGTYGVVSQEIANAMKRYENEGVRAGKLKFIFRRLVPPMSFYKDHAPFVYKYKIFIPFYLVWRFIRALVLRPKRMFSQVKSTIEYKKEN